MSYTCHHNDKFIFANLDLVEELFEHNKKAIILLSGASSSGKSFCANVLEKVFAGYGYKPVVISLDNYNFGLSGIIPNKVNSNYFNNSITNIKEISKVIKEVIYKKDFDNKYDDETLDILKIKLAKFFNSDDLNKFIGGLKEEWKHLNFDEPTVYDMDEAVIDIISLFNDGKINRKEYSKVVSERIESDQVIDGKDVNLIIVEGLYALNDSLLNKLSGYPLIKDYIDGNPKSLFLRRILRDKLTTSASSAFTISLYFKYVIKAYEETILPSRKNADIILNNDITFAELRNASFYLVKDEIFTQSFDTYTKILEKSKILSKEYQRDYFLSTEDENKAISNILRVRETSNDGKDYKLATLVHKGANKLRKDDKNIRPVNILLDNQDINKVWKDTKECLDAFNNNGFIVVEKLKKIKYRLVYKDYRINIIIVDNKGCYLEFKNEVPNDIKDELKSLLLSK